MVDLFDAYFRQADLDRDGRISGNEAVLFSQGSNLPNHVLAQVWTYANQNKTDFLGRPEFYNLLRLITVAQSGRELTPDIVKAALQGPAAAKIPPPQINSMRAPATPANAVPPQPTHVGAMRPNAFQNQVRGQQAIPPNMGMNQQFFPFANSNLVRPPQGTPPSGPLPMQGGNVVGPRFPGSNTPNLSTDWLGGRPSGAAGPTSQFPNRGVAPVNQDGSSLAQVGMAPGVTPGLQTQSSPSPSVQPRPSDQVLPSASKDSSALVVSGNGFSSDSVFGGDMFSVAPQAKQEASASTASSFSGQSSNIASGFQNPAKPGQPNNLQGSVASSHGIQLPSQSLVKQNQLDTVHTTSTLPTYNVSSVPVTPTSNAAQHPWPKMTQSNIQKYTKVFVEVDKDRDGKITGEEARSLFLSWRLPREVLKQVWDLSDQDNDSMLSLREFCIALYLMERYREGRPLPAVLPNSLRFDETLLQCTGQPPNTHTGTAWQRQPGLIPQGIPSPRPAMPHGVMKPPRAPLPSLPEETVLPQQQKARVPVVEEHLLNQLCEEERKAINSKFQEALDADKKVQELEKEILDSREKIEYYRSNMQELVLYKSRCDNRHNEITERVSADKREVESLAKKYEDKYKQTGDVASKLSLDEATFRAIQERKLELYNAIVKMEQGGTADGVLQARVDKIHSDLEELVKSLSERCKQYGLRAQPTTLVELPFGWQPGIQEEAADWDEDWDGFNHEGFAIIKELTVEVENTVAKPKPPTVCSDKTSNGKASSVLSSSIDENKNKTGKLDEPSELSSANEENKIDAEKPPTTLDHATEDESDYANSEDGSARSYHDSPRRSAVQSSSPESQSKQFGNMHDLSTHAKDDQSDYGGAESTVSGEKFLDESSWGAKFDSNDDADSLWGFGSTNTKDNDHDKYHHDSFFGAGDFSLKPIRTESPSAESVYGADKKSAIFDSVPSTPAYNAESIYGTHKKSSFFDSVPSTPAYSFSPRFSDNPEDQAFDRFSRFNSFNMSDGGLFPPRDSFSRVDSMRSTAEPPAFGTFARFDSMKSTTGEPSFGSLSRFDSMRSTADPPPAGSLARFDSTHSTSDFGVGFLSFDDADPFGSSGPFKSESQSPRRSTDNWNAF